MCPRKPLPNPISLKIPPLLVNQPRSALLPIRGFRIRSHRRCRRNAPTPSSRPFLELLRDDIQNEPLHPRSPSGLRRLVVSVNRSIRNRRFNLAVGLQTGFCRSGDSAVRAAKSFALERDIFYPTGSLRTYLDIIIT
jgi:hypothetical protein